MFNHDTLNIAENDTDPTKMMKTNIHTKSPRFSFTTVLNPHFKTQHMGAKEILSF